MLGKLLRMLTPKGRGTRMLCLEFLVEAETRKARKFVSANPELLQAECMDQLKLIADEKTEPQLRRYVLARRALLRRCDEVGIETAFGEWTKSQDEMSTTFHAFLHRSDIDDMAEFVTANQTLMDFPTGEAAETLIRSAGDDEQRDRYRRTRDFLSDAREFGPEQAASKFARSCWRDPLLPYPAKFSRRFDREEFAPLVNAICLAVNFDEGIDAIRGHPAAAMDRRTDVALLRFMMLSQSWRLRMLVGMLRARLALCRYMGFEAGLAQKIPIGWTPSELMLEELQPARAGDDATSVPMSVVELRRLAGETSGLAELLGMFDAYPELMPRLALDDSQTAYMTIPTPGEPPLGLEREAIALSCFTRRQRGSLLHQGMIDVAGAVYDPKREAPPHLVAIVNFELAKAERGENHLVPDDDFDEHADHVSSLLEEVLEAFTAVTPLDRAVVLQVLARHHIDISRRRPSERRQQVRKALEHLEQAEQLSAESDEFLASIGEQAGRIWLDESQEPEAVDRAVGHFERAIMLHERAGMPRWQAGTLWDLGRAHMRRGNWAAAERTMLERIEHSNRSIAENPFTSGQKSEFRKVAPAYHVAALSLVRQGRSDEALHLVEQGKARLIAELLGPRHTLDQLDPEARAKAIPAAAAFVESLASSESLLLDRLSPGAGDEGHPVQVIADTLTAARAQARAEWESTASGLQSALAARPGAGPEITVSEGSAAVSICVTEFGSAAMVLLPAGLVKGIDIGDFSSKDLNAILLTDRSNAEDPRGWMVDVQNLFDLPRIHERTIETIDDTLDKLKPLFDRILQELPPDIADLHLLPDGKLALLPLHAVRIGSGNERLIDRFAVSYAPSLFALSYSLRDVKPPVTRLYAYANPGEDLMFANAEARAIGRRFPEAVLGEAGASKADILTEVQKCQIVHFACHARFNADDLDRSYLELPNDELTLRDIRRKVNLSDCRLVTLSACQTSLIDPSSWDEFLGLPATFLIAGAKCVVGSLWEVVDISTAMLMQNFYQTFRKNPGDAASALQSAQRWLREARAPSVAAFAAECAVTSGSDWKDALDAEARRWEHAARLDPDAQPFAHPYHWAGFTLTGA